MTSGTTDNTILTYFAYAHDIRTRNRRQILVPENWHQFMVPAARFLVPATKVADDADKIAAVLCDGTNCLLHYYD